MNVVRFLARDAAEAVAQVRAQLGPDAVVLSVRQLPPKGVSRLWRKPMLEVCASLSSGIPNVQANDPALPPATRDDSPGSTVALGSQSHDARAPAQAAGLPPNLNSQEPDCVPVIVDEWAAECGPPMSWSEAQDLAGVGAELPSSDGGLSAGRALRAFPRKAAATGSAAAKNGERNTIGPVRSARAIEPRARKAAPAGAEAMPRKKSPTARRGGRGSGAKAPGGDAAPAREPRAGVCAMAEPGPGSLGGCWSSGRVLFQLGLHPLLVEKVLDRAREECGDRPPDSFGEELAVVRKSLNSFWRPASGGGSGAPPLHGFVGPPGSGKTTALCKWLAKSVLTESRSARVWRLDSRAANFAGLLDMFGEILSVPIDREWPGGRGLGGYEIGFLDFPGVNPQDQPALEQLRGQLHAMPGLEIHLVLNAAYDLSVLLEQIRALEVLPVNDLIFTHLDEEKRHGKLWNFILGTKFTIRFLSGGQNVPGDFFEASPELLISS